MKIEESDNEKENESPIKSIRTFSVAILNQKPTTEVVNKATETTNTNTSCQDKENERPFKCDICSKVFRFKGNLHVHKRIHTGERPFKCDICGNGFTQSSSFKEHRRIHTGEKPYKCEFCSKAYKQKGCLNEHRRVHTGEKPYECELCNKAFTASSNFIRHRRTIHTDEKRTVRSTKFAGSKNN